MWDTPISLSSLVCSGPTNTFSIFSQGALLRLLLAVFMKNRFIPTVVGSYTKIKDAFVDRYLPQDGEPVEEAKRRLRQEQPRENP